MRDDLITMSRLGTHGQWGNQLIQYAFTRVYARRYHLRYQVPAWGGQYLYGFADPPVTEELPDWVEVYEPVRHKETCLAPAIRPVDDEVRGHDFKGWAQYNTSWYAPEREFIMNLYDTPVEPEWSRVREAYDRLLSMGKTIIGLHLRRGDSGRLIWPYTPITWCLRWLREHWLRFDQPVLFLATETPSLAEHFREYGVVLATDLGIVLGDRPPPKYEYPYQQRPDRKCQMDFFPDWFLLQHSHVILASESTFSVTAAWLSRTVRELWRMRLSFDPNGPNPNGNRTPANGSCGFEWIPDPWDMEFSSREHLDDYPGIPGTQIDNNPLFHEAWGRWKPTHPSVPEDPEEIAKWMAPPQSPS